MRATGQTRTNGLRKKEGNKKTVNGKTPEVKAVTYDSDSFENHVIDLRGDDEYQSARKGESDVGASSDNGGRSSMKEEAQSRSETSVAGGDDISTDSDMAPTQSEEHEDAESNGAVGMDPHLSDVGEGTEVGLTEGTSSVAQDTTPRFVPGQLVWAKFARFPWWPAQVTDERTVQEGTGGDGGKDTDVLVRFFGTYDYGWVDRAVGLSEFDVKLQERSRIRKKALQKGIEEALEFRKSGNLPASWAIESPEPQPKTPKKVQSNGVAGVGKQVTPEDEGTEQRRAARKRKPKVLYEEEERVHRKPERKLRRLRIMRQLGLAAPAGSPFNLDTSVRTST